MVAAAAAAAAIDTERERERDNRGRAMDSQIGSSRFGDYIVLERGEIDKVTACESSV